MLVVGAAQSFPALHSWCEGPDGLHCADGKGASAGFIRRWGARRSVVEDERGLETEQTVPLFSGSGKKVEWGLERFRGLKGLKGSGATITKSIRCREPKSI